jgi:hypothetical protein
MADRIRPVHSSSRSRTRAPTAIRSIFQFVTPGNVDHEVVIEVLGGGAQIAVRDPGNRDPGIPAPQAHNIDRLRWHPPPLIPNGFGLRRKRQ